MPSKKALNTSKQGSYRSSKKNGRVSGRGGGRAGVVTEERLAAERAALLTERQSQLDSIMDTHDTLLREAFQLEQFRTIISYDPTAAKADNSAVWREYKESRDLLEQAPINAGPSARKTRRAHTERLQLLKGPTTESASPTVSSHKAKAKQSIDDAAIWSILADAKGKGKEKLQDTLDHGGKGKGKAAIDRTSPRKLRIKPLGSIPDDWDDSISQAGHSSPVRLPGGPDQLSRKRPSPDGDSISANGHLYSTSTRKKRRRDETFSHDMSPPPALTDRSTKRLRDDSHVLGDRKPRSTVNGAPTRASRHGSVSAPHPGPIVTAPPKFNITRIKLIVRRPPSTLSNPRQRPPAPRFGSSLDKFLSSYTTYNDQDFTQDALEDMARSDAALLDRIEKFRRQGRLLPEQDIGLGVMSTATGTGHKRGGDIWDQVVEEVVTRGQQKHNGGRQVASQIAGRIQAYWDGYALREDKAKAQEERRLRALAKATIKMVTNEWKKAVFHIREQERLRFEAEERRRGQSHLDAILDQSGQILETQQGDLTKGDISRSRSRSSSVSATLRDWVNVSDEEDESRPSGEEDLDDDDDDDIVDEDPLEQRDEEEEDRDAEEEEEVDANKDESVSEDDAEVALLHRASPSVESSLPGPSDEEIELRYPSEGSDLGNGPGSVAAEEYFMAPTESDCFSSPPPPIDLTAVDVPPMSIDSSPASAASLMLPPSLSVSAPATDDGESPSLEVHDAEDFEVSVETTGQGADIIALPVAFSSALVAPDGVSDDELNSSASREPSLPDRAGDEGLDVPTIPLDSRNSVTPPFVLDDHPGSPSADILEPLASNKDDVIVVSPEPDVIDDDSPPEPTSLRDEEEEGVEEVMVVRDYLKPFAVAPVEWNPESKVRTPILLRGTLRPYQQSGLEWLASLHTNNLNGILADEMGLGKTIQTISLLAHLACDQGIWGPHLIIVPTSVLLNWEMEFKKFLPGFKTLSYHGTTKRRKELRQGWNDKHHFNVCITSYTLASRDAHIFKRKAWYYMVLDEAHMIKNFKSQRWNILLMFRSFRRLLLTGTPLQNNLTELWALLQFLMSGTNFANLKEFGEWFSNPLEKAIEMGTMLDDENMQRVSKLHTVLRPYLLRRLKRDVEKELPSKYDHLVLCPLSKRQRFLYDEFMHRAQTRESLQSGVYQKIANILMQLRKVCNHPDLFEVRPIVTSFAMQRSAIADFEIQELLIRRRLLQTEDADTINFDVLGLRFVDRQGTSIANALETQYLDATSNFPLISELPENPPSRDTRSIEGFKRFAAYQQHTATIARWTQIGYLNRLRCNRLPIYSQETLAVAKVFYRPLLPMSAIDTRVQYLERVCLVNLAIKSYSARAQEMSDIIEKFAFVTPAVVALDMPRITLLGHDGLVTQTLQDPAFDAILHQPSVKLQIAFPDPSLLQYDCGKLQELTRLLREKKAGGHRVLIFTQMTKILDILEIFLNFHGYLYLRLDGATKIEDRQYITERFNADSRVFCFIASSRSGGVGINLTGADTVVFYDSDFNPQMDRQCEDRAHRIGQIRDVHIYRFVSSHTVEEAMLLKANQKRSLDDLVIQKGEFDWRSLFGDETVLNKALDETALTKALGEVEDTEDAHAAAVAAREVVVMEGADEADFGGDGGDIEGGDVGTPITPNIDPKDDGIISITDGVPDDVEPEDEGDGDEEGGTTVDYMLAFVRSDEEFFKEWRL